MSYFKPNTKRAIKLAMAIKALTATLGTSTYFAGYPNFGIGCFIVGAVANETINFLSDETNPETKL